MPRAPLPSPRNPSTSEPPSRSLHRSVSSSPETSRRRCRRFRALRRPRPSLRCRRAPPPPVTSPGSNRSSREPARGAPRALLLPRPRRAPATIPAPSSLPRAHFARLQERCELLFLSPHLPVLLRTDSPVDAVPRTPRRRRACGRGHSHCQARPSSPTSSGQLSGAARAVCFLLRSF
jgi:hypothetical protein